MATTSGSYLYLSLGLAWTPLSIHWASKATLGTGNAQARNTSEPLRPWSGSRPWAAFGSYLGLAVLPVVQQGIAWPSCEDRHTSDRPSAGSPQGVLTNSIHAKCAAGLNPHSMTYVRSYQFRRHSSSWKALRSKPVEDNGPKMSEVLTTSGCCIKHKGRNFPTHNT